MFDNLDDFELKPEYFRHHSRLHGMAHTYRVMCHVLAIGNELNLMKEKRLAFCAAFVHDMSRRHDGFSLGHGPRAAKEMVPEFMPMFVRNGVGEDDRIAIQAAVANHSQYSEFKRDHPFFTVTAMLKDADALDRIRMGAGNLNRKYLRFDVSAGLIDYASELYFASCNNEEHSLGNMIHLAESISKKTLQY